MSPGRGQWVRVRVPAVLFAGSVVMAQESGTVSANADDDGLELEEGIVTGTRIPRRDFTVPSPVAALDEGAIRSDSNGAIEVAGVFANNTDERTYDIFGRAYQLTVFFRY